MLASLLDAVSSDASNSEPAEDMSIQQQSLLVSAGRSLA